jgi:hypothetical protein
MRKIFLTLVIVISVLASGQAQDKLKIGEIKAGKLVVTNPDALKAFLMNRLGKSGTLGKEYQVSAAPEGNRFFLYYPVSGNKDNVTNIGILLVIIDGGVFIVEGSPAGSPGGPGAGGSYEVQCLGVACNSCVPNIKWVGNYWLPVVVCECTQAGGGTCNMISKIIIHVEI